jgi:hypothetical protein
MIWGAAMAAGAQAYRIYGSGPQAEAVAISASQKIVEIFHKQNDHINCLEITEIDKSSSTMDMIVYFLLKGGSIGCFRRAVKYAPAAFNEINKVISKINMEVPSPPVSCAAMLAQKMGITDEQKVMAAGLAGGIGLCGGACGALGTAIWIIMMNLIKQEGIKVIFNDPRISEIVDRFLKCTNYEFECSVIVGKKFENIIEHADYIRKGGCSEVIEVLTSY